MKPPARRARSGFTLTELLAGVAVLSVLVAVAAPALRGARRAAQRAACLSQLQSLGQALTLARDADRGLLPYADRPADVRLGFLEPFNRLAQEMSVRPPSLDASGDVRTAAPWACPADDRAAVSGVSYAYAPADVMTLWAQRDAARRWTTLYFESDPMTVVMFDWQRNHGPADNAPALGLIGINVLRMDGGAEPGHPGLRLAPRR
ncbi:MAG: prepilin-type N-terminal cleavage/methylation domain-containing protein [Planctomycetota bacterium]|nr:prepilin-type N-terminal cleavage/methylation domain-containing protein [Planctomycetota bacterium]